MDKETEEKYLKGLNIQEKSWSSECGIIRGHFENGIRYGCTKCEILVEMTNKEMEAAIGTEDFKKSETVKDPITEKGWVSKNEIFVREAFLKVAAEKGCDHFEKRMNLCKDKKIHDKFGIVALMELLTKAKQD